MKTLPIAEARRITEKFDCDGVIVIAFDLDQMRWQMTSYGETVSSCRQLADVAKQIDEHITSEKITPRVH